MLPTHPAIIILPASLADSGLQCLLQRDLSNLNSLTLSLLLSHNHKSYYYLTSLPPELPSI
jgi:hypothetical protein